VLRHEFAKVRHVGIRRDIENILVTMGGSDSEGITLKVLSALNECELSVNLKVIVGGLSNISDGAIENSLSNFKGSFSIVRNTNNMGEIMARSDIAIINSGLTKYELAAVGVPSIVISNNEYHSQLMEDFAAHGSVLHLGCVERIKETDIRESLMYLINDFERRQYMSNAGKFLIDGHGTERIFLEIGKEIFRE
jgi:spore coat polysaccharide biosynthesis protein SpsF